DAEALLLTAGKLNGPAVHPLLTYLKSIQYFLGWHVGFCQNIPHAPLGINRLFRVLVNQLYGAKSPLLHCHMIGIHMASTGYEIRSENSGHSRFSTTAVSGSPRHLVWSYRNGYLLK